MKIPPKNLGYLFLIFIIIGCQIQSPRESISPRVSSLTKIPSNFSAPVWSPSGKEIATSTFSYPQYHSAIYLFEAGTRKEKALIETDGRISSQAWSPDGKWIAFTSFGARDFREGIWIIDSNGENPRYMGKGHAAAWSPDGSQMAILSCEEDEKAKEGTAAIHLLDLSSGEETSVPGTERCSSNFHLAWAPDGGSIAYSYARDPSIDAPSDRTFLLDLGSKQVESLVNGWSWDPTWSTDSSWIAFLRGGAQSTTSTVAFYNREKSCEKSLELPEVPVIGEIAWSPDGTRLAVAAAGTIYIADLGTIAGKDLLACP